MKLDLSVNTTWKVHTSGHWNGSQSRFGCEIHSGHSRARYRIWHGYADRKTDSDGLKMLALHSFRTCLQLHTSFYQYDDHTVAFQYLKGGHRHSANGLLVAVGEKG
jgi:hypothetical protein